jgi:hypothetical protein
MGLKMHALTLVSITLLLTSMAAQRSPDSNQPVVNLGPGLVAMQPRTNAIGLRMDNMEAAPVKGRPFCATITTEHTQVFADGNRIHTTEDSTLCRDSEGRTRREADLNLLGAVPQESPTKLITIVDPVAGLRYVLDTNEKVARKMAIPSLPSLPPGGPNTASQIGYAAKAGAVGTMVYEAGGVAGPNVFFKKLGPNSGESAPTTENLGDQTIEGIHATGTRVTTTIPSGSMGNEQPMRVTSESWYSPELKATVMLKHNDPWAGELKIQFMSVNASEPDRALFTVPSNYNILVEKTTPFMIKLPSSSPPAP